MLCCLDPAIEHGSKFCIEKIGTQKNEDSFQIYLKGSVDQSPGSLTHRISRFFHRLELVEKIAEAIDESFHLLHRFLKIYLNQELFRKTEKLHHAAHDLEHLLHPFCFFGDITRTLATGKIFVYRDRKCNKIDYIRTISRLCHMASHLFSTLHFIDEIKLCSLKEFKYIIQSAATLKALGYAFSSFALIWDRNQGVANPHFASDCVIHLGGCLFEARHLIDHVPSGKLSSILNKTASIAGLVHAVFFAQRLMPKDRQKGEGSFLLPKEILQTFQKTEVSENERVDHKHKEGCTHGNDVKFFKVNEVLL